MKSRRGRPRKPGPRDAKGRLIPQTDHGTPETQAKRKALVGEADPALAASAPGILFAAGHLDREQFDVALEFRKYRCRLFGPPWPGRNALGAELSDKALIKAKERFERMVNALEPEQERVVAAVCVFDEIPNWFFCARLGLKWLPEDHRERELLIQGLDLMMDHAGSARAA